MKVTKKTLALLSGALVCCVAVTLLLVFAGRKAPETQPEATYYYANYESPDALMAASIENASGSVVIAAVGDVCYASAEGLDGTASETGVRAFFQAVYQLPLQGLIDGAAASDGQYGLTEPVAEVMLEDVDEGGLIFKIGAKTPDETAYYSCLSGDERVFLMDSGRAELFLAEIDRFFE